MVQATESRSPTSYRFNGFELSIGSRELFHEGAPCRLEPRTYDLLLHLLEARDRVVTKEELLEVVWRGTSVCEGAVSQCVSVLRKALGDTGRQQRVLRTFPRIGYRFVCPIEQDDPAPIETVPPPSVSWQSFTRGEDIAGAAQ
jgi:DNA-binding winged helix-turn-helix (wHTH) protein